MNSDELNAERNIEYFNAGANAGVAFLSLGLMGTSPLLAPVIGGWLLYSGYRSLQKGLDYELQAKQCEPKTRKEVSTTFVRSEEVLQPEIQHTTSSFSETEISYEPEIAIETSPPDDDTLYNLVEQVAANRLSVVFSGIPGTGKTTVVNAVVAAKLKADPRSQFLIVSVKSDRWLGLADYPGVFGQCSFDSFDPLFDAITTTASELKRRTKLPESERKDLPPLVLILDDYFSMYGQLDGMTGDVKKQWSNIKPILGNIITVGRECGVSVVIATHSLNIASLGIGDGNIRGCLSICVFGRRYNDPATGRMEGNFSAILNTLNNQYIIPSEYREDLLLQLRKLEPTALEQQRSIVLAVMGDYQIGLAPDLSWVENFRVKPPPEKDPLADEFNRIVKNKKYLGDGNDG